MKFLYPLAKRFIAGHDFDSAKPKIKKLMDEGYEVSIDYLGELSKTFDDCVRASEQYLEIINYYKDERIDLSIKPNQLGLSISQSMAYNFVCDIAEEALKYKHTIRLDMEGSAVTQKTIKLCLKVKALFPNIGIAIQANLYSTRQDIKLLVDSGISIRLVKGAYKEDSSIALQKKDEIESAFFFYATDLNLEGAYKPAIATHDERILKKIFKLRPKPKQFDYEFLYGVRRDLQKRLKNKKKCVRIYIPFGTDWLPYTLRRLKEWKNLMFIIKNVLKEYFK